MQGLSWQCLLPLTHAMPFAIISTDCGGTCLGIVSSCLSLGCLKYAVWSRVITAPEMTYFFSYSRKWGKKAELFASRGCGWRWCGSGCVKRGAWHNQGRAKWKYSPFCCSQPAWLFLVRWKISVGIFEKLLRICSCNLSIMSDELQEKKKTHKSWPYFFFPTILSLQKPFNSFLWETTAFSHDNSTTFSAGLVFFYSFFPIGVPEKSLLNNY